MQHETAAAARLSLEMRFFVYGEELEQVKVFKYLGQLLSYDDNDTQATRVNLAKACRCWARVSQVLRSENASSKVCGVFYKTTIQAVLLFESETWNLVPLGMVCMEGFHLRVAWRMHPRKRPAGTWEYPNLEKVLWDVGLQSISHYIGVQRQHIANFIVHWPIFQLCLEGVRKRGSMPRQFWWEQLLDLDAAGLLAMTADESGLSHDGD